LNAARQLSSLWKPRLAAKLLTQPPPAAFTGRAKEAVQESIRLLQLVYDGLLERHTAEATDQLLQAIKGQHHFELLAGLIAWVQQQPQLVTAASTDSNLHAQLWGGAMLVVGELIMSANFCAPTSAAKHVEDLTVPLDERGMAAAPHQWQQHHQQQRAGAAVHVMHCIHSLHHHTFGTCEKLVLVHHMPTG
jgi:hypothetical protein